MRSKGWFKSVSAKVLLATGCIGLALFALSAMYGYKRDSAAVERSITTDLPRVGEAASRSIAFWFEGRRLLIEMANDTVADLPERSPIENAFKSKVLVDNFLGTYFGAAKDGAFHNFPRIRALPRGFDPRNRPWFRQAVARRGTILIEPYLDASLPEPVVTIATPLLSGGRIVGVTGADFSMGTLVKMLQSVNLHGAGHAFIINREGKILVHPNPALVGLQVAQVFEGAGTKISGAGVRKVTEGGTPKILNFTRIAGLPSAEWYVGVVHDESAAYSSLRASQRRTIAATGIVTTSALVIIWLVLSRLVLTPLRRMTQIVTEHALAKYDTVIAGVERNDEIGALARALRIARENSLRITKMIIDEQARIESEAHARELMVTELQLSFGRVVDHAEAGDFSHRVPEQFADPELNNLARSINMLVETIDRGLTETGRVLSALASTDLSLRVEGQYRGSFAKLQADTNLVADTLEELIGQLRETAERLRGATGSLLEGAGHLAGHTEEQSSAIRTTSTAVQRLTATVVRNAVNSDTASRRAAEASSSAEAVGELMQEALGAMDRLTASSKTISGVIELIDDVAAQTSLLALNATIEAARAGEAGSGFAGVASEVKKLAAEVTRSSNRATTMINADMSEVQASSTKILQMIESLSTMRSAVRENSDHLEIIANDGRAQASAIKEISEAIRQIDSITGDNAGLVEDFKDMMREAGARATELDHIVAKFTFHEGHSPRPVPSSRRDSISARPW